MMGFVPFKERKRSELSLWDVGPQREGDHLQGNKRLLPRAQSP